MSARMLTTALGAMLATTSPIASGADVSGTYTLTVPAKAVARSEPRDTRGGSSFARVGEQMRYGPRQKRSAKQRNKSYAK